MSAEFDLLVIGGGVNGAAIARDAVGRGLSVCLVEKNDLASGTSSGSTKLFHGGLRYLEYYEFSLVRKALKEREVLLKNMPHISWPLRFVLPHHKDMRPAWFLRLGLFVYDFIGGRKILPATKTLALHSHQTGNALQKKYSKGFEYSDCWVDDARLVVLNARDAENRGAEILTRTACTWADWADDVWTAKVKSEAGKTREITAKVVVNAAGAWVEQMLKAAEDRQSIHHLRLVRGSHIVVKKLYDHDQPYFFQLADGRIILVIPYEDDYTLIGTTDADHQNPDKVEASDEEVDYLCKAASEYFEKQITPDDVVWKYAAVRPLLDQGAKSAASATRDYVLKWQGDGSRGPMLNIFGGKITTHRKLAEKAVDMVCEHFPNATKTWTEVAPLPGGDFAHDQVPDLVRDLAAAKPFLDEKTVKRLIRLYGTDAAKMLTNVASEKDLGHHFGADLWEVEVRWLVKKEFAQTAEDIVWRRTKLGLRMSKSQIGKLDHWLKEA